MHRLFVALRPPRAHRERLLGMMGGVAAARWQDDSQLHLTLRYVGEVDRRTAEDIAAALSALRHPRLSLGLAGVGLFDRRGRPDTLWAGVASHEGVAALHRKVDAAIVRAGLEPERRAFLPHITIARLGAGAGPLDAVLATHAGFAVPAETYPVYHLYESRLGGDGASYEIVETYALG